MFIAIQRGVYRHDIVGIYNTEPELHTAVVAYLKNQPDDYHCVECSKVELNVPGETRLYEYYRVDTLVNGPKKTFGEKRKILKTEILKEVDNVKTLQE